MQPVFIIRQGIIQVNSITVLQYSKVALLFCVDFKQKYAEYFGEDNDLNLIFGANENTRGITDKKAPSTEIQIAGLPEEWLNLDKRHTYISVSMGRYIAQVFMIRSSSRPRMVNFMVQPG
jgi:hypothetical protein